MRMKLRLCSVAILLAMAGVAHAGKSISGTLVIDKIRDHYTAITLLGPVREYNGITSCEGNLYIGSNYYFYEYYDSPLLLNENDQKGVAWEDGNCLFQKIYNVMYPRELNNVLALQSVVIGSNIKGWRLDNFRGLCCINAPRSGAILNLKKNDIVEFYFSGGTTHLNRTGVNGSRRGDGKPDGPYEVEDSTETLIRCRMTDDGQLGFCGVKNKTCISNIAIYKNYEPFSIYTYDNDVYLQWNLPKELILKILNDNIFYDGVSSWDGHALRAEVQLYKSGYSAETIEACLYVHVLDDLNVNVIGSYTSDLEFGTSADHQSFDNFNIDPKEWTLCTDTVYDEHGVPINLDYGTFTHDSDNQKLMWNISPFILKKWYQLESSKHRFYFYLKVKSVENEILERFVELTLSISYPPNNKHVLGYDVSNVTIGEGTAEAVFTYDIDTNVVTINTGTIYDYDMSINDNNGTFIANGNQLTWRIPASVARSWYDSGLTSKGVYLKVDADKELNITTNKCYVAAYLNLNYASYQTLSKTATISMGADGADAVFTYDIDTNISTINTGKIYSDDKGTVDNGSYGTFSANGKQLTWHVPASVLKSWFLSGKTSQTVYLKLDPDECYTDRYIKATINVNVQATASVSSDDRIATYWYEDGSMISRTGKDEIHANHSQPGNTIPDTDELLKGNEDFAYNLLSAFRGGQVKATASLDGTDMDFPLSIVFDTDFYKNGVEMKGLSGTAYQITADATHVYATCNGQKKTVLTLQNSFTYTYSSGKITKDGRWAVFQKNDFAFDLLNAAPIYNTDGKTTSAFQAMMTMTSPYGLTLTGDTKFKTRFLRPIDGLGVKAQKYFNDANEEGHDDLDLASLFTFTDWRQQYPFSWTVRDTWPTFYGIREIRFDFNKVQTDIDGIREPLAEVAPYLQLRKVDIGTMGVIRYQNNGAQASGFNLFIPVTIVHNWGEIVVPLKIPVYGTYDEIPEVIDLNDYAYWGETLRGDLNNDGLVDVADITTLVNVIIERVLTYDFDQCDLNSDQAVNVGDVVTLRNIIFTSAARPHNGSRRLMAMQRAADNGDYLTLQQDGQRVAVGLENTETYTAFQFCLTLPEGMQLKDVRTADGRTAGHQLTWQRLDGSDSYLVMGYSLANTPIGGTSGRLLTLETDGMGEGEVTLSGIRFATTDNRSRSLRAVTLPVSTGIRQIAASAKPSVKAADGMLIADGAAGTELRIYTAGGALWRSTTLTGGTLMLPIQPGVYVVNGQKLVVK